MKPGFFTARAVLGTVRLAIKGTILASMLSLAACGGGGGVSIPDGGDSGFQPGVFLDSDTYAAQCQAPRSGINPATNQSYPDIQGTTTDENNYLRSYSNETYLWYDEITDQDPSAYNDTLEYFDLLVTEELTPSNQPKDKFHFTYDSEVWYQLSQGGVSAGYGAQWAVLSPTVPRDIRVAYTEPNSPATNLPQPLARGAIVTSVDGFDINTDTDEGIDALNAALFPSGVGEEHTFGILDLGAANERLVTMTTASITSAPVQNLDVINTQTGVVGYMSFNDHVATAEQALINAVNFFNASNNGQGIDDLVLDLRYNGGGYLAIASEFAYMIAGAAATAGQTFEEIQFNDKHPVTNPITGRALAPTPFYSQTLGAPFNAIPGQALPTLDLPRVYVITGGGTCSASEAIMNGLRGIDVEVIQIGSTTCGKPYGFYAEDNCGTTYFTIQFRGVNAKNFGDYTDGFSPANTPAGEAGTTIPGCSVADDFTEQLGSVQEDRLAMALAYRDGQSCTAPSGLASGAVQFAQPLRNANIVVPKSPWLTNRILLP